jgi:hypothetical protein
LIEVPSDEPRRNAVQSDFLRRDPRQELPYGPQIGFARVAVSDHAAEELVPNERCSWMGVGDQTGKDRDRVAWFLKNA